MGEVRVWERIVRIGHGFDAHAFDPGRRLMLGGVEIPHRAGLAGHSDADVLLHAVCDALLGAAALGDLGRMFPEDDETHRGADSRALLRAVVERVAGEGFAVGNVDATIVAQAPRLVEFLPAMRANVAADCGIDPRAVNVKATTTERMGFTGREEGIAAHAVALIVSR